MQLEDYVRSFGSQDIDVKRDSKGVYDPTDLNHLSNKLNIDYDPASGAYNCFIYLF